MQVRSVTKNQDVYENFLRCLYLFNEEVISRQELLSVVQPFFTKSPELYAWLKDFVGINLNEKEPNSTHVYEPLPPNFAKQEKLTEEQALEIGEQIIATKLIQILFLFVSFFFLLQF